MFRIIDQKFHEMCASHFLPKTLYINSETFWTLLKSSILCIYVLYFIQDIREKQ